MFKELEETECGLSNWVEEGEGPTAKQRDQKVECG